MARLIVAFIFLTLFSSCQQIFFYLTSMAEPVQQEVYAPESTPTAIPGKNDITILLYNENNIYAYSGTNLNSGAKYNYNSIRNFLKEKKTKMGNRFGIFIKAAGPGNYKNTVNMLDQMAINDIKNYSMAVPSESEKNFIKQLK